MPPRHPWLLSFCTTSSRNLDFGLIGETGMNTVRRRTKHMSASRPPDEEEFDP